MGAPNSQRRFVAMVEHARFTLVQSHTNSAAQLVPNGVPAFAGTTVAREGAFRAEEGATLTTVARAGGRR